MTYIFGFVLLLGILIFIHELGHFLLAKAVGVRVETFSIGMGTKIIKFKHGETEYALSLIPLGGYVKLTGQDPREEVPKEMEHRSFRHKSLLQRTAVVLAGPLFNAALTVILFVVLYSSGAPSQAPVLNRVLEGSISYQQGLRSGDWVESLDVNGQNIRVLEQSDLGKAITANVGQELTLNIKRESSWTKDAENMQFKISPITGMARDPNLGVFQEQGILPGVEEQGRAPLVQVAANSWAANRQIPDGFWIESIETQIGSFTQSFNVRTFSELQNLWSYIAEQAPNATEGQIILRGQSTQISEGEESAETQQPVTESYTMAWTRADDKMPSSISDAGFSSSELVVIQVMDGTPAAKLGLAKGDEIRQLNGANIQSFQSFKSRLQELASAGNSIEISWLRGGESMSASVQPEKVSTTDPVTETEKQQFQIGAAFLALPAPPMTYKLKADSFGHAIQLGWDKSVDLTVSMAQSFYYLATGKISHKTLGGPILIGKIAGDSVKQGWEAFVRMMAFISLNLFILNLLPIPVLDGGHLLLFAVEAVRRKPLSLRIVEYWTTAGFLVLMGLIAVVFFNDLSRLGLFNYFKS